MLSGERVMGKGEWAVPASSSYLSVVVNRGDGRNLPLAELKGGLALLVEDRQVLCLVDGALAPRDDNVRARGEGVAEDDLANLRGELGSVRGGRRRWCPLAPGADMAPRASPRARGHHRPRLHAP